MAWGSNATVGPRREAVEVGAGWWKRREIQVRRTKRERRKGKDAGRLRKLRSDDGREEEDEAAAVGIGGA